MEALKDLLSPEVYEQLKSEMDAVLIETAAVEYDPKYFTEV